MVQRVGRFHLSAFFMVALAGVAWTNIASAQSCEGFNDRIGITSGSDARVTLDASGSMADDKEAIECAFEAAAENGISRVQLQQGDFYLSRIEIRDFVGSFEGRSIAATTLNTIPDIIDCREEFGVNRLPAAITFVEGQPRLRTMTINAGASCSSDDVIVLRAVVLFTGESNDNGCDSDITQSAVDRVVLNGPGIESGVQAGIAVRGQDTFCRNTILGTFKVNRSEISGFDIGVYTSMQGGAQVDLNFNVFSEVLTGYRMERSRQITSVTLNEFVMPTDPESFGFFTAIDADPGQDTPDKTSLTVSGNDFSMTNMGYNFISPSAIRALFFGPGKAISLVVKENHFVIDEGDDSYTGIILDGVSNAVIIDNTFSGESLPIQLDGGADNAILANDFQQPDNETVIRVRSEAVRTIIGPGQNARVSDSGTGTILTDNDN